jgi:hypothetical protein
LYKDTLLCYDNSNFLGVTFIVTLEGAIMLRTSEGEGQRDTNDIPVVTYEVREDYEIVEGMLQPKPKRKVKDRYAPMLYPELPGEIAKLKPGDMKAVLQFARQYGLLGYGYQIEKPSGDPLLWIWTHAYTITVCLELTALLQEDNEAKLQAYFDSLRLSEQELAAVETGEFGRALYIGPVDGRDIPYLGADGNFKPSFLSAKQSAQHLRRTIINGNIGPITRIIWDTDGKGERSFYNAQGTIRFAYWHLADMLEHGKDVAVRRCAGCNAWFVQTDKRQRFCPPPRGLKKAESPCAVRQRMRRYRQKPPLQQPAS